MTQNGALTEVRWRAVFLCWSLGLVAACAAPPAAVSPARGAVPRLERLPAGRRVDPELCSNATDDNDNGLIDEGCALEQGQLQFTLAWADLDVDLDLLVTGPTGEVALVGARTADGLVKMGECPSDGQACQDKNQENVVTEATPAPGTYVLRVRVEQVGERDPPIVARLGVRSQGRSANYRLILGDVGSELLLEVEEPKSTLLDPPQFRK